ncbi:hypothetical protein M413DRAFT_235835 [Hebeloma cylindrosporum]|uniref:Uncharacterized protein n=1 Tax=Hebeloma cylindrosporum TaxID=76867 RepID=A0A0C3C699_HEBCY|nr:hypothetical protein M413DRAFT_235835 [Hebeloma cylindrosporum h7]
MSKLELTVFTYGSNERRAEIELRTTIPVAFRNDIHVLDFWVKALSMTMAYDLKHTNAWECAGCGMSILSVRFFRCYLLFSSTYRRKACERNLAQYGIVDSFTSTSSCHIYSSPSRGGKEHLSSRDQMRAMIATSLCSTRIPKTFSMLR